MAEIPGSSAPGGASIPSVPGSSGPPRRRGASTNFLNRLQSGQAQATSNPLVFLGFSPGGRQGFDDPASPGTENDFLSMGSKKLPRKKNTTSRASLLARFNADPMDKKREMARLLALGGYLDLSSASDPGDALQNTLASATLSDVMDAYDALVSEASDRFTQAGQDITPEQLLMMNIEFRHGGAKGINMQGGASGVWDQITGGSDGQGGLFDERKEEPVDLSGTSVQRVKTRDIWNPKDAQELIEAKLQEVLQRDPTRAEYEDFVAALRTEQRENPLITTQRTTTNRKGEVTAQTTRSRGGVNPEEMAEDFSEETADAGDWQMMGTFWPALLDMLGSAVPGA